MGARLPVVARRRARRADWWRPGLPVHPPERADVSVADLVLAARVRLCWHERDPDTLEPVDGAMRWTPGLPIVRF